MKLNNKGFTLVELLAVVLIIAILSAITILATSRYIEKQSRKAFISEANLISRAAISKQQEDKSNKDFSDDIYGNRIDGKACYNVEDLLGKYVQKDDKEHYKGSVEVCYGDECGYDTMIWLTNGEYYIQSVINDAKVSDIKMKFNKPDYISCGTELMYGGTSCDNDSCDYEYTGTERRFVAPKNGKYSLEVWGASGGNSNGRYYPDNSPSFMYSHIGGLGGYSYGEINLKKGDTLYITVGGRGNDDDGKNGHSGYHGVGAGDPVPTYGGYKSAGAGGATHMAFASGLLQNLSNKKDYIVIVAGGGGASGAYYEPGNGGGFEGSSNSSTNTVRGTQTSGFALGKGQDYGQACWTNNPGGGGGYYGAPIASQCGCPSSGGGSGFINNPKLTNAHMYGYNVETSDVAGTLTYSGTDLSDDPEIDHAKRGDGYARVTYLGAIGG